MWWIHDQQEHCEIMCQNSCLWIHLWIHASDSEFMIMKSYMSSLSWIHVWIQCYEEYREIMAEFLEMNSQMKSWLNSLILEYSLFSIKFVSVRENVLLIQSNHQSLVAVTGSSLYALRLLHGCCSSGKATPWASQDNSGYPSIRNVDWDNPGS